MPERALGDRRGPRAGRRPSRHHTTPRDVRRPRHPARMYTFPCHECGHAIPEGAEVWLARGRDRPTTPRASPTARAARRRSGSPPEHPRRRPAAPFAVERRGGVALRGEEAGRGPARPAAPRPDGHAPLRRPRLAHARARRAPGDRLRRARPRRVVARRPAPEAYTYDELVADAVAVLDARGVERAVVVGQSMGSATAVGARAAPPGARGRPRRRHARAPRAPEPEPRPLGRGWPAGLERGGPEGFLAALGPFSMAERWRERCAR